MFAFTTIVLAAGKGTRMQSEFPKVLHPLCGEPMIQHIVSATKQAGGQRTVVVVGHQAERVKRALPNSVEFVHQREQKGTGHAVLQAESVLADIRGPVLITCGDTPLYRTETLRSFVDNHMKAKAAASVLTAFVSDPTGYGRIVRSPEGEFQSVVEDSDASEVQRDIKEINTGTYCVNAEHLFSALHKIKPQNAQGEYYLPDVLFHLATQGQTVRAESVADANEALGINNRKQLSEAEAIIRQRILHSWQNKGVTIVDPATTFIDKRVTIGIDTILYPFTILEGNTAIGARCRVGPFVHLHDAKLDDDCSVEHNIGQRDAQPSQEENTASGRTSRAHWFFSQ